MRVVIGIDPGISGAIVKLDVDRNIVIEWALMPVMKIGSATRVNATELANLIRDYEPEHAFVEQVGARPGQGVASMFNFGHNCGVVMGVIGALEIPHTLVTPQKWKKAAGLIGTEKDASRTRAIQLWPGWKILHKKTLGQAFADAALIARYGQ
jgi:crossover junction endodeoxyribonuclease RuvC